LIFKKKHNKQTKQNNYDYCYDEIASSTMWPKPFFEIAFEFFGCACLYYEKKITSRMVEELNLVKLLQGEKK